LKRSERWDCASIPKVAFALDEASKAYERAEDANQAWLHAEEAWKKAERLAIAHAPKHILGLVRLFRFHKERNKNMSYFVFDDMIGVIFSSVTSTGDGLTFRKPDGSGFRFYHEQDCCESVYIESVAGDLSDLENSPLLQAEKVGTEHETDEYNNVKQWTFYKFGSIKGSVTVRFLGTSNGYYSTDVSRNIFTK